MLSTWQTGFSQQAVRNAGRVVSRVSVRDIDSYQLLTLSHGVGHAVHGDGLHPSGRNGAKPRVHGEHAVAEASLQDTVGGGRRGGRVGDSLSPPTTREMVSRGAGGANLRRLSLGPCSSPGGSEGLGGFRHGLSVLISVSLPSDQS